MYPKMPTILNLYTLCRAVKTSIDDDCRAFEEDDTPGVQLTVGCDTTETSDFKWSYQTGDNSYMGGAYFYPDWAVIDIYRSSNCRELARDIQSQLAESFWQRS